VARQQAAVVRDEQVLGLDVAMGDAGGVRRGEARSDLPPVVNGLRQRQRARVELLAQRFALEQLERQVGLALVRTEVEDTEDVRMAEGGERPGFEFEPSEPVGVVGKCARQNLERDVAAELGIAGAIDLAHGTGADGVDDFVGTNGRAGRQRRGG
jgi:hypothetical protein